MGIVSFYTAADKHLQFAFFSSYQTTLSVKNYCSADKKYKYIYEDEGQLKESFRLLRMLYTLISDRILQIQKTRQVISKLQNPFASCSVKFDIAINLRRTID